MASDRIAPAAAEPDAVIAAVVADLLARVPDERLAGAIEAVRRLPATMHRAVLHEAASRTDRHRAGDGALMAGAGL